MNPLREDDDTNPIGNLSSPYFSSENQYIERYSFTYQRSAGVEFRSNHRWALSTGYRWMDSGKIKGPHYLRDEKGYAAVAMGWKIRLAEHQLFLALKYFL